MLKRPCVRLGSLTGALDHGLQHPVALVPSPPERQRLVLIEELLQVGGRGGMGGAEVEGAVARVALWILLARMGKQTNRGRGTGVRSESYRSCIVSSISFSPCSSTTGFLSASACLISIWQ